LAENGHNYPVYALGVVGQQATHNIVSISNDGKMCVWSQKDLRQPRDHYMLDINPNITGLQRQSTIVGQSLLNKANIAPTMAATRAHE
jgi:hypothetical protein